MKTLKLLAILLVCITKFGYSQIVGVAETVGDVKYSILPPAQFTRLNKGWVLMDGGASAQSANAFKNSDLHKKYGLQTLPDARGQFIRGMNEGRDVRSGDADGNRAVGMAQFDLFKQHHHSVGYPYGANQFPGLFTNGAGRYQVDLNHNVSTTSDAGGNETRPRNIALYVYIKIDKR